MCQISEKSARGVEKGVEEDEADEDVIGAEADDNPVEECTLAGLNFDYQDLRHVGDVNAPGKEPVGQDVRTDSNSTVDEIDEG